MAPTAFASSPSASPLQHLSRSLSFLLSRSTDPASVPPLASIFALIVRQNAGVVPRSAKPETFPPLDGMDIFRPALAKRQNYILAIPTTYQGLNDGPEPGVVAGIVLGSIAGFVLVLFVVLSLLRLYAGRTFVETKVVERRSHHHSHSRSPRSRSRSMSERPRTRRETTVIEESRVRERTAGATEVIVEEEQDDIVEVIEEHSPERRGTRRESKRASGYRTVDPAEFGGGSRPMRKVSRR